MKRQKPQIPQRIGDYRIEKFLGHGGMATIYLGEDEEGRKAAIKVIRYDYADEKSFSERFVRECKATSCLSHPMSSNSTSLAPLKDNPFMPWSIFPYESMENRLTRDELFSEEELLLISRPLLSAIACYNERGLVHTRLKAVQYFVEG